MFKIVKREEMSDGTVILNEIEAPLIARKAKPGQFVILKANENGERIPLTMADTDPEKGTITVIYMVVGKSTALFKTLKVGDGLPGCHRPSGQTHPSRKSGEGGLRGRRHRHCGFASHHPGAERGRATMSSASSAREARTS